MEIHAYVFCDKILFQMNIDVGNMDDNLATWLTN